jgi:HNH endonuclease
MSNSNPKVLDQIYERDEAICWLCNRRVKRIQASRDHIIPKSHGGPNHIHNYALAHKACNGARGNNTLLPSLENALAILNKCQKNSCGKCGTVGSNREMILTEQNSRWVLTAVCYPCGLMDRLFEAEGSFVPKQRSYKNGLDMSDVEIVDTLQPYQIEQGDYIQFTVGRKLRRGTVMNEPIDHGDFFTVEIHDEQLDDKHVYNINTNAEISLLMYTSVMV